MVKIEIPKTLPDCELLRILAKKIGQKHDIDFNFFGKLDEFRERVSGEVRQINNLFPEYTPHDEQYHLKRLFHVADTVLGKDHLEEMNSAELFVLAVSLYGHDWGMAVSNSEKQYIVTDKPPEGIRAEDLWILPYEQARFTEFARKQRLTMDDKGCVKKIPIEVWREYVRQTHAFRSGARIRRFFEKIDGGVAEDRTPYVIWKFVAPRDPHSKMEWAKHRALRPVTCPSYQEGRIVRVDGSTDDHEVYAALEDLRIWCEDQLRGCNDLLARMSDPRHKLSIYHVDWRVAARGFNPVPIQFEFDRERMFEILGDEIYQGDPYVFLRELLQNSIDAIRMRREVLQREGIDLGNFGVIHVTVEHGDSGDALVTWCDDGIGMDEYIVRNYLAVAGKSYYHSKDFEREGLKIDPISRFGVGILSCFMVADRFEIESFKDPYLPPGGKPLRITIPAMHRQFRIETLPQEGARVGTTVRVFVAGKKIPTDEENKPAKPLDVTGYLSIVAGFVEFPIAITEGNCKTIVLHPKQDAEAARKRFGEEFKVHQLNLSYPWSKAILPQDLANARKMFREERLDIASDLGLKGYDGVVAYLAPFNDRIDLVSYGPEKTQVIIRGQTEQEIDYVRWSREWVGYPVEPAGISRSSKHAPTYAVYRDGILLPRASPPSFLTSRTYGGESLPLPRLVVNVPKSKSPRVDLARTQLLGQPENWDSPILQAHLRHLFETSLKDLLALDPAERWYQLGRLIAFHNIKAEDLWQVFPHEHWPLIFLEPGGRLKVLEWQEIPRDAIYLAPDLLIGELTNMLEDRWLSPKEYEGRLASWAGERCLIARWHYEVSHTLDNMMQLWRVPVNKSHALAAIRWLQPPWKGNPPLLQRVWLPMGQPEEPSDIEALLEKAVEDPTLLHPLERSRLQWSFGHSFPETIEFPQPFEQSLAYGWKIWNLKHPATQALLQFTAALELSKRRRSLSEEQLGRLQDTLDDLFEYDSHEYKDEQDYQFGLGQRFAALHNIFSLAREAQLYDIGKIEDLVPTREVLVPGTIDTMPSNLETRLQGRRWMRNIQTFGQPLTCKSPD